MIRIDAAWLATAPLDMRAGTDTALARVIIVFGAVHPHRAYLFAKKRAIRLVATANSTTSIPAPILSRMHVIEIAEPTQGERAAMAAQIFANVVRSMQLRNFNAHLPDAVLPKVGAISPREFRRHAQMAVGRAITRGDVQVKMEDFRIAAVPSRTIGF